MKHIKLKKKQAISKKQPDVSAICTFYFSNLLKNLMCYCFSFNKFQQQQELWQEVERVTAALRTENEAADAEVQFLCEMFKHIPLDLQHRLLLVTADHCEDTMEHCRLLLLLLKKFPQSIVSHGVSQLLSYKNHFKLVCTNKFCAD